MLPFSAADRLYLNSQTLTVRYHAVDHPIFRQFSVQLGRLLRALGEDAGEDYWRDFLRAQRRYRFNLSAAPLPFDHMSVQPRMAASFKMLVSRAELVYPAVAKQAAALTDLLFRLSESSDNPLLDCLELSVTGEPGTCVLVPETRLVEAVRGVLRSRGATRGWEALAPADLRGRVTFSRLVAMGSPRWYPEYIFSAPRAPWIDVVSYRWIRGRWRPRAALVGARASMTVPADEEPEWEEAESFDEEWPAIDWAEIERRANETLGQDTTGDSHDDVEARLFLVYGGQAVFLDAEEGSTCLAIDLFEEERSRVKRIRTEDLEPGMFVLVRTEGGGDYVVPVADRILGDKATVYRAAQRDWKAKLRAAVRAAGLSEVSGRLRELGLVRADEGNLRNWLSERSIATQEKNDFAAIMRLVGLDAVATDRYWSMMRGIRTAHLRAGMMIRRRLVERVKTADLPRLQKEGRLDFLLPEAEGGRLSAFRVEGRAPATTTVHASRIGRVFERQD